MHSGDESVDEDLLRALGDSDEDECAYTQGTTKEQEEGSSLPEPGRHLPDQADGESCIPMANLHRAYEQLVSLS
jgi:hypothetical protein